MNCPAIYDDCRDCEQSDCWFHEDEQYKRDARFFQAIGVVCTIGLILCLTAVVIAQTALYLIRR